VRVLIVCDSYPPLIGGGTRASQQLALGLARRGHQVCVATSWQAGHLESELQERVLVRRLRALGSRLPGAAIHPRYVPPPFPDPELTLRLRRILSAFRPDVIHTYGWITYSLLPARGRLRTPVVLGMRDYANVCPKRTLVRDGKACSGPTLGSCISCAGSHYGVGKGLVSTIGVLGARRPLRRRLAGVHSVSSYVQQVVHRDLVRPGVPSSMVDEVVPDWRDATADSVADPAVLASLPDAPFILYVGALRLVKGIRELLEAYDRLSAPKPPLVMIGTQAPDTPADLDERAIVIRNVSNPTVLAAWDKALFGVVPSVVPEPLGNVVHEAMSRGKTVIGTYPGGHRDMIVDEQSGLLVPAGSIGDLVAAMERLIRDGDLRHRLEVEAATSAQRFTESRALPLMEDLLMRVADRR
jgi:glycosyltransferase involved in cell wall biosynthesis